MADLKVTVDYSQLTGLIKTADQTKRTLSLMGQSLAQSGDMSAYMRGINQVVEAQKKLPAAARMSRSEIMKLGQEMKRQAQFATALGKAAQQAAVQMDGVGKRSNRAGVVFQQAGYQIGDFIVQVQSGTDVMVAMGQQMTQLVGVGAMLSRSTKWIAAFSALGIIVPLATAAIGALLRMRGATESLEKVASTLKETLDSLDEVTFSNTSEEVLELQDHWSGVLTLAREYYKLQADQAKSDLMKRINPETELGKVTSRVDQYEVALADPNFKLGPGADMREYEALLQRQRELVVLSEELNNLNTTNKETLAESFNILVQKLQATGDLSEETLKQLGLFQEAAGIIGYTTSKIKDASDEQAENARDQAEDQTKIAELYEEERRILLQQVALQKLIQKHGEESAEVQRLKSQQEYDNYEASLKQQGIQGEQLENLLLQKSTLLGIKDEMFEIAALARATLNYAPSLAMAEALNKYGGRGTLSNRDPILGETGKSIYAEAKRLAEEEKRRLAAVAEITAELTTQYNLAKVEAAHTKDSAEYREAERTAIIAAAAAKWDAAGATEAEKRIFSRLLLDSLDFEESIRNQADAAKEMAERLKEAASAMRDLSNFSVGLDQKLAVAAAEVAALKSGADAAVAGTITGLRFDLESKISAAEATGVDRGIIEKMFGPEREKLAQYGELLTEKGSLEDSKRGGDKETAEERLSALLKTAESERDLVGVEEERATQLRRAFTLTEQISEMEGGLTEERMKSIQTIVDLEAKTRLLQEAEERREAQIDEIVGHIRSAFDSLIDGTETVEEAFRKMMYNIAKSIWEQQVMDPLANAATKWITNTFFSAKGSAWNNGVQMFANGGVVNSATPFRHAGGMGIMGEAGAEAIMPLKRGPDGKLGVAGGGNVTIHQNFNFAANGDESVKRIIAQEAPKIASMTQGQIMDARRRGGAMRNTFG